jgi:hypothetical protein
MTAVLVIRHQRTANPNHRATTHTRTAKASAWAEGFTD